MRSLIIFLVFALYPCSFLHAQVGISANGVAPDPSAMLDLNVTSLAAKKGLLVPRMTAAERVAIAAPAQGALVYETTTDVFWHFNGTVWVRLFGTLLGWRLPSNTGITAGTHFVGTTDAVPLEFRQGGLRSGWVSSSSDNTLWGYRALQVNTGTGNSALGTLALWDNTSGTNNTACGRRALGNLTTGSNNVAVGYQALTSINTNSGNTAVGSWAMAQLNTATGSTAVGMQAMMGFSGTATNNTAMGYNALLYGIGTDNTAFGYGALQVMTTGDENTAVGYNALGQNVGARNTVLFGMTFITNADRITTFGVGNTTGGDGSCGLGWSTLASLTNGEYNIGLGSMCAQQITTGDYNVAIGRFSLANSATGSLCTAAGNTAIMSVSGNNQMALGYNAVCPAANIIRIGTAANNNNLTGGYGAWQNISDARFKFDVRDDVPGLAFINGLRPVTYTFDVAAYDTFTGLAQRMRDSAHVQEAEDYNAAVTAASAKRQTGFLAQEVDSLAQDLGYEFSGVHRPLTERDHYTIGYEQFVAPLVKAVQEQQAQLEEVRAEQRAILAKLKRLTPPPTAVEQP
ncbi:MAG: tail fiber domain-containing protein [Flavobacteriales bacterium]|nr:tail fiber domain-containing protein [Flavobacteriales bacterium]